MQKKLENIISTNRKTLLRSNRSDAASSVPRFPTSTFVRNVLAGYLSGLWGVEAPGCYGGKFWKTVESLTIIAQEVRVFRF